MKAQLTNHQQNDLYYIILALIVCACMVSCAKQKPTLKKPAPITYGDPRQATDTTQLTN